MGSSGPSVSTSLSSSVEVKMRVTGSDSIPSIVKNEVEKALHAYRERENRKKNLMVFGLEEGNGRDGRKIERVILGLGVASFQVVRFNRVGKKAADGKPRPLLVQMGSASQKAIVLRRAPQLEHQRGCQRIFIRADMDREARERWKCTRNSAPRSVVAQSDSDEVVPPVPSSDDGWVTVRRRK